MGRNVVNLFSIMTQKIDQKRRLRLSTIIKIVLVVLVMVFFWRIYSLVRFEGRFSPWYVYGISNPYKYWQEHIGLPLIENGKQYDLKLSIDENNPETYNIYRNEKYNFEFKYPKGFYVKVDGAFFGGIGTSIEIFKKGDVLEKNVCNLNVLYKGWGVGKNWLPRSRAFMENYIKKGNIPFYFLTQQGQIVHTNSCGDPNSTLIKDKGGLISYINPNKKNSVLNVSFGCNDSEINVINDVIATFQFIK